METAEPTRPGARLSGSALNWATLMLLVVIWGSTFAGITIGTKTISPAWFVTGRMLSGALFLGLWLAAAPMLNGRTRAHGGPRLSGAAVGWYVFIGLFATALPFTMYAHASESIGSASLALCNGATPFGTVILAAFLLREKLTASRLAGVAVGFAGLVVLMLPAFGQSRESTLVGIVIAILGAWLYSVGNVGTRMAPRIDPVLSSFIIVASGGLASLVWAIFTEPFPVSPSTASITAMLLVGLLPTAFAMVIYVWLIQRAGPVFVSFTTYMQPLWAAAIGLLFLGEELHWTMLGAMVLILIGVAIANRRPANQTS